MPTIITHGIVGYSGSRIFSDKQQSVKFALLSTLCSIIPDFDAISFKLGVKYGDFFGHRGFSHSIVFAAIIAFIAAGITVRYFKVKNCKFWPFFIYFFIITISHSILDAFTDGGLGVALFSPFDNTRYFFPFHPIRVAPISIFRFFSINGVLVLLSELLWIWLPLLVIIKLYGKYKIKQNH
ncbi:MAG: metal-dependent hydrolase [Bacteroidota bacterium]|nr:metal-dependent hydrolase [Bacteroidota bacterium]